jgi:hypothetical protein
VNERTNGDAPKAEHTPEEQATLARDLGAELTDSFIRFVRGDLSFADLTFMTYETLESLHIIASGEYELDYDDEYDIVEATEEQEELSQEPSRED